MNDQTISGVLLRPDEQLALMDWPELESIDQIILGSRDCYVAAMGFEARALAGLERACEASGEFHVALVRYLPKIDENREMAFLALSEARGRDVREFDYDRECPAGMGSLLADYASKFDKVYVDISGMSRFLIVQIIVALVQNQTEFYILYAEAKFYPPTESDYEEARKGDSPSPSFISSGIFEIVSSPELSSVSMLGSAIRLISFPSFDPSQLSNLVQEVQPTYNNVVRGKSPRVAMAWRTGAIDQMNHSTVKMLQRVEVHEASTFDYRVTLKLILDLYKRYSAFDRIVIAPTGSKMQSVAIGILRGVLEDLQIVYPTPLQFLNPGHHTEGVREIFQLRVKDFFFSDR